MVSHSISPKFSGKIPYVLSKPRICFLGSKDKTVCVAGRRGVTFRARQIVLDLRSVWDFPTLESSVMVIIDVPAPVAAIFSFGQGWGEPDCKCTKTHDGLMLSVRWNSSVSAVAENVIARDRERQPKKLNARQRRSKRRLEEFIAQKREAFDGQSSREPDDSCKEVGRRGIQADNASDPSKPVSYADSVKSLKHRSPKTTKLVCTNPSRPEVVSKKSVLSDAILTTRNSCSAQQKRATGPPCPEVDDSAYPGYGSPVTQGQISVTPSLTEQPPSQAIADSPNPSPTVTPSTQQLPIPFLGKKSQLRGDLQKMARNFRFSGNWWKATKHL